MFPIQIHSPSHSSGYTTPKYTVAACFAFIYQILHTVLYIRRYM
jgi:hypothetical protein